MSVGISVKLPASFKVCQAVFLSRLQPSRSSGSASSFSQNCRVAAVLAFSSFHSLMVGILRLFSILISLKGLSQFGDPFNHGRESRPIALIVPDGIEPGIQRQRSVV